MNLEDISSYIESMRTAIYGRDMREAICQSFTQLNTLPAEINSIKSRVSPLPKIICTFMLSVIFGGLKSERTVPSINNASGLRLNSAEYDPTKGDKIILWKTDSEPLIEGVDYSIEESASEDFDYKISLIEEQVLWNVGLQIWNIPTGSGGISGSAYTALSSLTTESISGTATQEQDGE